MKNTRILRFWLYRLWCAAGALAVGILLAYLTNWVLGLLSGLVVLVVLWSVFVSRDVSYSDEEEGDLANRLRTSLVYKNLKGNRFHGV